MGTHLGFCWSTRIFVGSWVVLVKAIAYTLAGKELK